VTRHTKLDDLQPLSEREQGDLLELAHPRMDPFAQEALKGQPSSAAPLPTSVVSTPS
jgi:hypothetical protein